MKLTLINSTLASHANFIHSLTLSSAQANIARVRIENVLATKHAEYTSDRTALIKQFANLDETGEPKLLADDKTIDIPADKASDASQTINELDSGKAVIDLSEYEQQATTLKTELERYNEPLNGDQAQLLVAFLDGIDTKEND